MEIGFVEMVPKLISLGTNIVKKSCVEKVDSPIRMKKDKADFNKKCFEKGIHLSNQGKLSYEECQKLMIQMGGNEYE